ncbi:MAG: serine hydrolase [Bradymonadia bacterium]
MSFRRQSSHGWWVLWAFWALWAGSAQAAEPAPVLEDDFVEKLFQRWPQKFHPAVDDLEGHRVQVLITEVERVKGRLKKGQSRYRVVRHGFRVDAEYFYPASAVKTLAAVATMRRLRRDRTLKRAKITLDTPLAVHRLFVDQPELESTDETHLANGRITLGHEIKKMSIVSDNRAFDRLYGFAGQDRIDALVQRVGLEKTRIFHRLSRRRTVEENRWSEPLDFHVDGDFETPPTVQQKVRVSPGTLQPLPETLKGIQVGQGHMVGGELVETPMSFTYKNRMGLVDLQNMLMKIVRPDLKVPGKGFGLRKADRAFLKETMRMRPGESTDPLLPEETYDPLRFKPVLGGLSRFAPVEDWTVWNKAGKAYGFRIENAYFEHPKRGRRKALFITVALYTNANGVLNDDEYEYDTVADPFIHDLTEAAVRTLWGLRPKR